MNTPETIQSGIIASFQSKGGAFEQFDYLLQLSAELDEMDEELKTEESLVKGCQSQVWMHLRWTEGLGRGLCLRGDSDTLMVRGVIRIFQLMFEGQSADAIAKCPLRFVDETELKDIFDAKRQAGVSSIASSVRSFAFAAEAREAPAATTRKQTLKQRLEIAQADADRALDVILHGDLSREAHRTWIRRFTLAKFFLSEEEAQAERTDDILKLANASVEKLLRNADKSIKLAEGSTTCTNQSSTDIKKVLLSLTLQRALNVRLSPEESADLETITQLSDALFDARRDELRAR